MTEIFAYQQDNMNIAIASGLAEELTHVLGHKTQVYGPTVEASLTHAMVVAKLEDTTLYSIKVDDGKATLKVIGGKLALLKESEDEREFAIQSPSFVSDLVAYVTDLRDRSNELPDPVSE